MLVLGLGSTCSTGLDSLSIVLVLVLAVGLGGGRIVRGLFLLTSSGDAVLVPIVLVSVGFVCLGVEHGGIGFHKLRYSYRSNCCVH